MPDMEKVMRPFRDYAAAKGMPEEQAELFLDEVRRNIVFFRKIKRREIERRVIDCVAVACVCAAAGVILFRIFG